MRRYLLQVSRHPDCSQRPAPQAAADSWVTESYGTGALANWKDRARNAIRFGGWRGARLFSAPLRGVGKLLYEVEASPENGVERP